jgi:hypothetical protein
MPILNYAVEWYLNFDHLNSIFSATGIHFLRSEEIKDLKSDLIVETRKGKRAELTRALTRANRALKKLM